MCYINKNKLQNHTLADTKMHKKIILESTKKDQAANDINKQPVCLKTNVA